MTDSYTIKRRENPFQFFASEFIGDIANADDLLNLDADVGALVYVINTGYTYIQAQKGDWKQLKAGKGSTGRPGDRGPIGPAGVDGVDGKDGLPGKDGPRGFTGTNGEDGRGWQGGSYDYVTGQVTFTSDDGLTFKTGDLRGAPSPWANLSIEQLAKALKPYL
jgi:hypothetical protein